MKTSLWGKPGSLKEKLMMHFARQIAWLYLNKIEVILGKESNIAKRAFYIFRE